MFSQKKFLFAMIAILIVSMVTPVMAMNGELNITSEENTCGPMDVVFVIDATSSMEGAIRNVQDESFNLIQQIILASGGDYQLGLVTFRDDVQVVRDLSSNNADDVIADINNISAKGGGSHAPEASDEALNTVINRLSAGNGRNQVGDFNGEWRSQAVKIVMLITDAPPGGFNDRFDVGIDDVNARQRADEAKNLGILISAVYVPTLQGGITPELEQITIDIMRNYANVTGGVYMQVQGDGTGTANAIRDIIDDCGESPTPTPVPPTPTPVPPTPTPTPPPPNEIPEPTTILLLGSGLAGLAGYVRRKRNHA